MAVVTFSIKDRRRIQPSGVPNLAKEESLPMAQVGTQEASLRLSLSRPNRFFVITRIKGSPGIKSSDGSPLMASCHRCISLNAALYSGNRVGPKAETLSRVAAHAKIALSSSSDQPIV